MIDNNKYFVFIVSGGRTGTKYFGDSLNKLIPDSYSIHEPDVWSGLNYHPIRRLRQFGFYHMFMGKLLRKTGIRNLSQQYIAGKLTLDELSEKIRQHRENYYQSLNSNYIIESYGGWYGALPGIQKIYHNYRIVAIIRDARDWVTSMMNWGAIYGPRDWVSRLGLERLNPSMMGDIETMQLWPTMSQFEKLCWTWTAVNSIIFKYTVDDVNAQMFRFEDLFFSKNRREILTEFLAFITHFKDKSFSYTLDDETLSTRIHESVNKKFPSWQHWDEKHAKILERHCSDLMRRFYYGNEPDWQKLID